MGRRMTDWSEHMADKNPANRDPITGAPGAHPIGTGAGAASAGATGAAIGAVVGGPVGAVVGGAIGAVAGGLAGKGVAESVNPTVEDAYWRDNYKTRPYAKADMPYDTYQPAYRYGWESRSMYPGKKFDEVESGLATGWDSAKGTSKMAWADAKGAAKDAWHRVDGNPRT